MEPDLLFAHILSFLQGGKGSKAPAKADSSSEVRGVCCMCYVMQFQPPTACLVICIHAFFSLMPLLA